MNNLRRYENVLNQRVSKGPTASEQTTSAVVVAQPPANQPLKWPAWAEMIARMREPEDRGVGDTVHRKLGSAGEAFKLTLKTLGVPCGCSRRRDEWNRLYSYENR